MTQFEGGDTKGRSVTEERTVDPDLSAQRVRFQKNGGSGGGRGFGPQRAH